MGFMYLILFFIFTPVFSKSPCTLKVTQPRKLLQGKFNQSISITCLVNTSCHQNKEVQWYVFMAESYYQLNFNNQQIKYRLQGTDLHISRLSHSDDGLYYCAASDKDSTNSGAQDIGTGTRLTVKENDYSAGQILLFALVALLSFCNIIIVTLFICIKTRRVTLLKGRRNQSQDEAKDDSTKRAHFRAVVQELYTKRNLRRNKKSTSTDVAQKSKVENPRTHKGKDDIYQNSEGT